MEDQKTWDDRYNLINHPYLHYGTVTTNVSITAGEDNAAAVILANGAITITLPFAAENKGRAFYIKNIGVGVVTITPQAGDSIDGGGQSLPDQYDVMLVVSDGTTNWWILSSSDL